MKFGSLFAGIGGIDLGLERAGMECVWQVEIDDFCQKVLTKHWPNVPKYGDIRDVGKHNLETVDLIAGGFPCQPVSLIGRQKGDEDERWLWDDFYRIICEIYPKWVLIENVPGLRTANNGRLFAKILWDLSSIGYDAEWETIWASDIGAPHKRARIFILAYAKTQPEFQAFREFSTKRKRLETWQNCPDLGWGEMGTPDWELPTSWIVRDINGIPDRMDRGKALGNAVVPQVAEHIGRMIMEANK